ncbi:hypothetical protein COY65_00695 [Candidatus Jorgensenbacteria bacterium CG_4_10_14_0_8_um_filter_39_13]|uniref:NYN domain-containing protein n=1 Tax=Candidatus Jorgensenbacteria bacterium CG_4_10_14_0_8_um_filter_39_13 TaxID=1974589 RepID=A0A2M7RIL7_9BACT|nr:MAG: hypothetical protein COY65_00695 [Candidatus Jorgensenbacteria bacterium CG_4_10_14_0_8_um_filter_39_13]PJA95100.1 MAG: hypothetical protein CO130_00965 [Candidatus Jorgensenbacteria bacterium CG_4_9_14_3_um_filter_38_10]
MANIYKDQRVGIFIDVQNIYHSAKNLFQARVNFKELIKNLVGDRQLVRAVAYVVKSDTAFGEESFFKALQSVGLELRLKDLQVYPGGFKKADWDVGLAVDAIRMADSLNVIILVTGDGDFVPLVEYLKWGLGRQVEIAAFHRTASGRLKEVADRFVDLESMPKLLLSIKTKTSKKTRQK